jgi:cation diffusion facilitator CzcD-associated flavoprotein CzcO
MGRQEELMANSRIRAVAADWLHLLDAALQAGQPAAVTELLEPDAYWRDILALTWDLHTFYGTAQIDAALARALPEARPRRLVIDEALPPRPVRRAGRDAIEVAFRFYTEDGSGRGVAALDPAATFGPARAWTVMTALDRLGDPAEPPLAGPAVRDFSQPTWRDRRAAQVRFDDRDPAVLVVGAGQAGLAVAARLRHLGVDTLVVDREERVGDNWRHRYDSLVLHNEIWANHLPYLPFPPTWPTYIPKDMLADWLEAYAAFMELNVWTATDFVGGEWDDARRAWTVRLRGSDGQERQLHPRHLVMASGVSSIPRRPSVDGLSEFAGEVLHASDFHRGESYAGARVTVVGTGTSGHDIAQELCSRGADVTLVQRSPCTVVSTGPNHAGRVYSLYRQGRPTEESDLLNVAVPYPVLRQGYQLLTQELAEQDAGLLDGLRRVGFRLDFGADNTGFQMKYLRHGGGYYLNVGCSQLLADGRITLLQQGDISRFVQEGALLADGRVHRADVVILATGYLGQQEVVQRLLGDAVAAEVGPVWGYDDEGELRNMWRRTAQPGLWFTAGSLAQSRIFSRYLALQILACESGLLPLGPAPDAPSGAIRPADLADLWDGQVPGPTVEPLVAVPEPAQ